MVEASVSQLPAPAWFPQFAAAGIRLLYAPSPVRSRNMTFHCTGAKTASLSCTGSSAWTKKAHMCAAATISGSGSPVFVRIRSSQWYLKSVGKGRPFRSETYDTGCGAGFGFGCFLSESICFESISYYPVLFPPKKEKRNKLTGAVCTVETVI